MNDQKEKALQNIRFMVKTTMKRSIFSDRIISSPLSYCIDILFYVFLLLLVVASSSSGSTAEALAFGKSSRPKLILIAGGTGTGKSTFGMSVALDQEILKCISTDTVRAVLRSFVGPDVSPALHRSSYAAAFDDDDDPVRSWREACAVLNASVDSLVNDAIARKVSLVVEGVHLVPSSDLIRRWEESGGTAIGVLLWIDSSEKHQELVRKRGYTTGNKDTEETKIASIDRIRIIQDEMIRLAEVSGWTKIEQKIEPDPLELVAAGLYDSTNSASFEGAATKVDDGRGAESGGVAEAL